jgi:hypothetical protein
MEKKRQEAEQEKKRLSANFDSLVKSRYSGKGLPPPMASKIEPEMSSPLPAVFRFGQEYLVDE